jgi:simple sugar transport system permease protein
VQAVGANAAAAKIAGIEVDTLQVRVFVLSGALAGLAGALEVAAVHHRFYRAFSPGYGFDGITVAFLVGGAPAWLWVSALLLASLRASDKMLQLELGMSPNAILVIQSTLLLAAACRLPWGDMLRYLTPRIPNHRGSKSDRSGGAGPGSQPADPAEVQ